MFPENSRTRKAPAKNQLDTPSLLGLHSSAPYLHDARAKTLEAIFEDHNPDNRHGDTAGLSAQELGALVSFLESL